MNSFEEIFEHEFAIENNIKDLPTSAGLVFFTDNQNLPITLLTAANIRRTVKTKLVEQQEKTKKADLISITAKIYYSVYCCKFRLAIKHYDAVRKIFDEKYKDYITLVHPWFLTVDINDKIPFFAVTRKPSFKEGEKIIGPFPTQKSADVFMASLEDGFKLCRKTEFAQNSDAHKSCPYLQMDACVGICAGKISRDEYIKIIEDAFQAGCEPQVAIDKLEIEMQTASKELDFENAAGIKKKIEKLSALKKQTYRWTTDVRKLKIVHIDKSAKIKVEGTKGKKQSYACMVMNIFKIVDAGDFLWDNHDIITSVVTKAMDELIENKGANMLEKFSIITYFLYRSKPSGQWLKFETIEDLKKIKDLL